MTSNIPKQENTMGGPYQNTDKHLWPQVSEPGAPEERLHITKEGALGINCGGHVYVKPIREWHKLAGGPFRVCDETLDRSKPDIPFTSNLKTDVPEYSRLMVEVGYMNKRQTTAVFDYVDVLRAEIERLRAAHGESERQLREWQERCARAESSVETTDVACPVAGCPNRVIDTHGNTIQPEEPTALPMFGAILQGGNKLTLYFEDAAAADVAHEYLATIRHAAQETGRDPPPPDVLAGALQDVVHTNTGQVRAGRSMKASAQSILDRKVTVCSACLCASCWQGEFYCDSYKTAGTVEKTVRELYQANLREDSGYWFKDANTGKVDYDAKSAAKRAWLAENGGADGAS